jgi:Zinc knuckle
MAEFTRKPETKMGLENIKCFECQQYGHLAKDCPDVKFAEELKADASRKPPWCGQPGCDEDTRLVAEQTENGLKLHRCRTCHPNGNTVPVTYARCPRCKNAVYAWDKRTPCGQHKPVGRHLAAPAPRRTGNGA